jgi:ribosomal protein S15P/S13E
MKDSNEKWLQNLVENYKIPEPKKILTEEQLEIIRKRRLES